MRLPKPRTPHARGHGRTASRVAGSRAARSAEVTRSSSSPTIPFSRARTTGRRAPCRAIIRRRTACSSTPAISRRCRQCASRSSGYVRRRPMLRFEWTAYVTPDVVSRIATEAGVPETVIAAHKPLIGQILDCAGGLPFIDTEPSLEARTAHGLTLFAEGVSHTLKDVGATCNNYGYVTSAGVAPNFGGRIVAQAR